MKKCAVVINCLITILVLALLSGCSSSSEPKGKNTDEQFLASLTKGWESQWEVSADKGEIDNAEELQAEWKAELDQIKKYNDAEFEDAELQEKAKEYIQVMQDLYDNAKWYFTERSMDYQDLLLQRSILISQFVENYGLTVDKNYTEKLEAEVTGGKAAAKDLEYKDQIQKIVDGLKFELDEEDEYERYYYAIFENTTDTTITGIEIAINLLDKDGVIVDDTSVDADNIKPGQKAKLEFSTSTEFKDTDMTINYYTVE